MTSKQALYLLTKYKPVPSKTGVYKINIKELGIKRPSTATLNKISLAYKMFRGGN
jgi:hypothetical protein